MRVLHVLPCLEPATGGPARSVPALIEALEANGVTNTLLTMRRGRPTTVNPRTAPFAIEAVRPVPGTRQLPTPAYVTRLRRLVRQHDLVHLHSLWNPVVSLAAREALKARVPYVISPRGMLQRHALSRRRLLKAVYARFLENRTIEGAAAYHFFTSAEAHDSRDRAPDGVPRIVVPNGIDPAIGQVPTGGFRSAFPQFKNRRLIVFVGRLHWSKGIDVQLEAMRLLVERLPNVAWVALGPEAGEGPGLRRLAKDYGLNGCVHFLGPQPRQVCLQALADADVALLTSLHEAHSVAMNEALATGAPLVLTTSVGFPEAARWGAALEVPWEAHAIADACIKVLSNPELRAGLSIAGRDAARQHLAWPAVAQAMVHGYERVLRPEAS